jgi:prevent-host-death family protein
MDVVNMHEAKTHFSKLIEKVELGEEVVIARAGKPVAKLVSIGPIRGKRVLGQGAGQVVFQPLWDDPMTEQELAEWGA